MRKPFYLFAIALALGARAIGAPEVQGCSIDAPPPKTGVATPCSTPTAPPVTSSFGLLPGDVVVSVDGKKVVQSDGQKTLLSKLSEGHAKTVVVLRNGQRKTLRVSK